MAPFVHPAAIVEEGATIGEDTRVWAFAHILAGARIGRGCNICDQTFVENEVLLGDRVTIKCGVYLWDGITLEDDVFVGPNATFTNDKFPRSKHYPGEWPRTVVEKGASIGANATILPGLRIGQRAMIGAGAVVTRDVPPLAIVVGNPARIVGYVDTPPAPGGSPLTGSDGQRTTRVRDVLIRPIKNVQDLRGDLGVIDWKEDLPFAPVRAFFVYNVPNARVRGEHAHRVCHQFMVCLQGSVSLIVDDGFHREEIELDRPSVGVHVPPMVWGTQYKYSKNAVLLVFASHSYDPDDYIREYADFLKLCKPEGSDQ